MSDPMSLSALSPDALILNLACNIMMFLHLKLWPKGTWVIVVIDQPDIGSVAGGEITQVNMLW